MFAGPIFGGHPWLTGNKNDNVVMQPGLERGGDAVRGWARSS